MVQNCSPDYAWVPLGLGSRPQIGFQLGAGGYKCRLRTKLYYQWHPLIHQLYGSSGTGIPD
jgi:hypothetical protein